MDGENSDERLQTADSRQTAFASKWPPGDPARPGRAGTRTPTCRIQTKKGGDG